MAYTDTIPGYTLAGAVVRRPYDQGGERIYAGKVLSRAAFDAISHAVRRLWVRDGALIPFYVPDAPAVDTAATGFHVIHRGAGRYDVVQGVLLNAEPLTKDQAEALIARPAA